MVKRKSTKGKTRIEMRGRPMYRTHSLKKVQRRTPSGQTIVKYKYKKHSKHICALCKEILHGKPRGKPVEIKRLHKSERVPERPFGGMLCSKCSRKVQALRAKLKFGIIKREDIPVSLMKYMVIV